MRRFRLLLLNEFKLFRTGIPIHVVAILQPTIMYLLMTAILVHPTFDVDVDRPTTDAGHALVAAMGEVGSPIGQPYINPILVDWDGGQVARQVVAVEEGSSGPTATQHFGQIDSNMVKNFRNRLTAAALVLWHEELGDWAVIIDEVPWLLLDVPYNVYFGMAMLPMTVFLAASFIGAILTAQEFEIGTIAEYRLAPTSVAMILGARLTRLVLMAFVAATVLLLAVGLRTGFWPSSLLRAGLSLLPAAIIAGCLGTLAGLLMRKVIPAFLIALVSSFVGWIMGSAFGLAAGFSGAYEFISRLTPFTHTVELLFPTYFGTDVGKPLISVLFLLFLVGGMLALTSVSYHWRVTKQQ